MIVYFLRAASPHCSQWQPEEQDEEVMATEFMKCAIELASESTDSAMRLSLLLHVYVLRSRIT